MPGEPALRYAGEPLARDSRVDERLLTRVVLELHHKVTRVFARGEGLLALAPVVEVADGVRLVSVLAFDDRRHLQPSPPRDAEQPAACERRRRDDVAQEHDSCHLDPFRALLASLAEPALGCVFT